MGDFFAMKLSERETALLDGAGFNRLFDQEISQHRTYRRAYEALENERVDLLGRRLYSDYGSFRSSRSQRHRRKRK